MKRTFTAVLAAVIAVLGLAGVGSTASAAEKSDKSSAITAVPFGVFVSEFATTGPTGARYEFVELCNRNPDPRGVDISGFQLLATFGSGQPDLLATIPMGTILAPGQAFLVASEESGLPANLFFSIEKDLPNRTAIVLQDVFGSTVDAVATVVSPFSAGVPTAPLTFSEGLSNWSIHRKAFTGTSKFDFAKSWPATPIPFPARCSELPIV